MELDSCKAALSYNINALNISYKLNSFRIWSANNVILYTYLMTVNMVQW